MDTFADIEGPVRIGFLFWILIAAASLFAAAIAYAVVKKIRSRPKKLVVPVVKGPSPVEMALGRLEKLRADGLQMDAEPFTVEVSDIVRHYLEAALKIPAREQTTEEFLQGIEFLKQMPEPLKDHMPPFLTACDMVKFARQSLAIEKRSELLDTATTVVSATESSIQQSRESARLAPS